MRRTTIGSIMVAASLAACSGGGGSPSPAPTTPSTTTPIVTASPVASASVSPASSSSPSPSASATHSPSPSPAGTESAAPSATASAAPTATPTQTPTPAATPSASAAPTPTPVAAATNGPALTIAAGSNRLPISPDIYGVTIFWSSSTPADLATFAKDIGLPANRDGGDATTRYNWQVDSTNAGSDFYFIAGGASAPVTPGATVDTIVNGNRAVGAATKSIVTVPIIDYITASATLNCSYPNPPVSNQVAINGLPGAYDPYVKLGSGAQCGTGSNASGYINDTNPGATDIANTTAIQQAWVSHFVSKYGAGASGGVPIYELDNEPNGWIAVHHDVRPQNIGYHELLSKSIAMARAIKAADPTALVLGPGDIAPADEDCNSGEPSGIAGTCNGDGAAQNGGTPLGLYYLQQFAAQPTRLLDYYSMHYPGSCCFSTNGTLADMVTAIQRHKAWIAQAYPGTKLAYDEWNRGTGNGFANALATADGLGVMGQQGVSLASFWGLGDAMYPSAFAFLMMRDYDGNGAAFGETSVSATSADASKLTVYAAQRTSDGALTIMVVNSTTTAYTSSVALGGISDAQPISTYVYSAANPAAIVHGSNLPAGAAVTATFAPQSITMLVVPSGTTPLSAKRRRF